MALEKTCMWMDEGDECVYCYDRAKIGYNRLLGEDHAKTIEATKNIFYQTAEGDELIAELRALWERVKVSLSDEAITYGVANSLGEQLRKKGKYEEAKVPWLAAL